MTAELTKLAHTSQVTPLRHGIYKPLPKAPPYFSPLDSDEPYEDSFESSVTASVSWLPDMLLDRSLVGMGLSMALFAAIITGVTIYNIPNLANILKDNLYSTAVGNLREPCEILETKSTIIHLFINIFATMVLGISNTYQQLATALDHDDIKWALNNSATVTVGTNSPFAMRWKRSGKMKAVFSWIFLVITSLPVHLVANSVIGPAFYIDPKAQPPIFQYESNKTLINATRGAEIYGQSNIGCWFIFVTGIDSPYLIDEVSKYCPKDSYFMREMWTGPESSQSKVSSTKTIPTVLFTDECIPYKKSYTPQQAFSKITPHICNPSLNVSDLECITGIGCHTNTTFEPEICRLSIRMSASIILSFCLIVKTVYIVVRNFRARGLRKSACLSYGDVIATAVSQPDIKQENECLVNADAIHRRKVRHQCHKHCNLPRVVHKRHVCRPGCNRPDFDVTGDSLGHCQKAKCKEFNSITYAASLLHPTVANKEKHSLIHTLGGASVAQMIILWLCVTGMIVASAFTEEGFSRAVSDYKNCGSNSSIHRYTCPEAKKKLKPYLYFGLGSSSNPVTLTALRGDSIRSEIFAFLISNGAQLVYSLIYLLLIYNITLLSIEREWGQLEYGHQKLRITLAKKQGFRQSYFLQLPKKVLLPIMLLSSLMHWLLGQSIFAREHVIKDMLGKSHVIYDVVYAPIPLYICTVLMLGMTAACWWTFSYSRSGFIPTMYGSVRVICAAAAGMDQIRDRGVIWGDLGEGKKFRKAGLTSDDVGPIVPGELYA